MNIFVAGLNFRTTDSELTEIFSEYGNVNSAKVVTDKLTKRSKGYGFVEMDDDAAAKRAIEGLNGVEFNGRELAVTEAKPRENRNY